MNKTQANFYLKLETKGILPESQKPSNEVKNSIDLLASQFRKQLVRKNCFLEQQAFFHNAS